MKLKLIVAVLSNIIGISTDFNVILFKFFYGYFKGKQIIKEWYELVSIVVLIGS